MQKRKPGQPHKGWKAAARNRQRKDPITIGQEVLRAWCKETDMVVDALIGAELVACVTAAIIADRAS